MRFKYIVSFTAGEITDQALREAFDRLGADELNITRTRQGRSGAALSKIQKAIVSILADDRPHWRRDIVQAAVEKGFSYAGVNKALVQLTSTGEIVCFERGLYGSPRASADAASDFPPRKNQLRNKSSFEKVIELIHSRPQTAAVLKLRNFSRLA